MSPHRQLGGGTTDDMDLARPVERQVEARSADDVSGSIVRTLYFADTFLMNGLYMASSSAVLHNYRSLIALILPLIFILFIIFFT